MQLSVGGYVCERELGRGGQGVVWLARDRTGRQVVVKFLLPGKEYDEVALARVRREFGAASRVGELATARVLDADLSGRHPYIVSEFVPGPTIHQHVAANGPLPSGRLQSLALAVAHALAQVHRVSVVHRDIKPSNILLSPDGPRIIDFGIARDDRLLESALTTPGSVLGSPAYMSPEQVKSLRVTSASDVFSLGGTLYFAATGRHPFDGESDYEVLVAVCERDADLTAVPEPVRSLIADCLRKDPAERPTAAQLVTRLAGAAEATESAQTESGTPPQPPPPERGSGAGPGPGTSAKQLRLWGLAAGSAAAAVLLAIVLSTTSGGSATEGGAQAHGSSSASSSASSGRSAGSQPRSYTDDLTDSGDWSHKDPALGKITHEGGTMLVDPRTELEVWPQAPFEPSSFAVRLSTQTAWYGGEGGVGLWCNGSGDYQKGSRWATYLTTGQEALIVREFRFKGTFQHDRVVEVDLADVGLKVESQQQVDMSMTCSSAGEGRIKVELAVDGTRVASYTGTAFDERGCGVAAFHYSATDPQGTAFHAGFERFTASEPSAR
ncbi:MULTISPECIES: protein kinase domain-containing protein [unclassified Streptomyces]|uniref:serine/threonine-protein kinase n=1 Tax=unclassified Streptomyces TaxID=2593676 RepID=UPI002E81820A|nr:protein kinase [Streptomyces sp. NBC_00589]WTI33748.1 protein kinase [Streptomyces sp. NBC_00775]WUB32580.1 protein kinase [Streptomyces sp. NBC_00589]